MEIGNRGDDRRPPGGRGDEDRCCGGGGGGPLRPHKKISKTSRMSTSQQIQALRRAFDVDRYPSRQAIEQLAMALVLTTEEVHLRFCIWRGAEQDYGRASSEGSRVSGGSGPPQQDVPLGNAPGMPGAGNWERQRMHLLPPPPARLEPVPLVRPAVNRHHPVVNVMPVVTMEEVVVMVPVVAMQPVVTWEPVVTGPPPPPPPGPPPSPPPPPPPEQQPPLPPWQEMMMPVMPVLPQQQQAAAESAVSGLEEPNLRGDGPIFGGEFDALPPGAFKRE